MLLLLIFRLGIQTKVIEQAESLRTGGTSLTLFKNGWSVLDAIGVGNQLRSQFLEIEGYILDKSLFPYPLNKIECISCVGW